MTKQQSRRLALAAIIAVLLIRLVTLAIAALLKNGEPKSPGASLILSNSENFLREHVTGGVGLLLMMNQTNGLPRVQSVVPGSPAEAAGVLAGDHLLKINEFTTAGQPLAQIVDACRGWVGGQITLTVQRADVTNLVIRVRRASWASLGVPIAPSNASNLLVPANSNAPPAP